MTKIRLTDLDMFGLLLNIETCWHCFCLSNINSGALLSNVRLRLSGGRMDPPKKSFEGLSGISRFD